jgi:hypothetical protein
MARNEKSGYHSGLNLLVLGILLALPTPGMAYHPNGITLLGDLSYRDNERSDFNQNPFSESLDIFLASGSDAGFSTLVEFVAERTYQHTHYQTERLLFGYRFNDHFRASIGRFHTPVGYWNSNMPHGRIIHETAERPFFMSFAHTSSESSILPIHIVGVGVDGEIETKNIRFSYELHASNPQEMKSRSLLGHPGSHASYWDTSNTPELSSDMSYGFRTSLGLTDAALVFGLSATKNTITEAGNLNEGALVAKGDVLVDQTILALEAQYSNYPFELSTEVFHVENDDQALTHSSYQMNAFYIQGGVSLTPSTKVIYRFADLDLEKGDLLADLLKLNEESHHVFTLRYDLNEFNTFKFELDLQRDRHDSDNDIYTYRIQWSFLYH